MGDRLVHPVGPPGGDERFRGDHSGPVGFPDSHRLVEQRTFRPATQAEYVVGALLNGGELPGPGVEHLAVGAVQSVDEDPGDVAGVDEVDDLFAVPVDFQRHPRQRPTDERRNDFADMGVTVGGWGFLTGPVHVERPHHRDALS